MIASGRRALETALRSRVDGDVDFTAGARALYAADASNYRHTPIGLVWPRTVDDVIAAVQTCREHGAPILPRGGGTSLAGQCCNVAVVLDMSRHLNHIMHVDPDQKMARVQPGVVLDTLQRALKPYGLMYGPDPATHGWCTIGGMIGNNSCGVHSLTAGLTADAAAGLEVLTADGLRLQVGPTPEAMLATVAAEPGRRGQLYSGLRDLRDRYADQIRSRYPRIPRRVSGYNLDALLPEWDFDVARALVGSEGTCVTILEATVRLVDRPGGRALMVIGYRDIFTAADEVMTVLEAKPIGLEAIDEVIVRNLRAKAKLAKEIALLPEAAAWLLVEFGGDTVAAAEAAAQSLRARLERQPRRPVTRTFIEPEAIDSVWLIRESALGATAFVPGESPTWEGWEDAAVPPERLGQYLREFRQLLDRYGYTGALYGHFGQGCVHTRINFDLKSPDGIARFQRFIHDAADLVVFYGGSLSGEHGDGQARAQLLPKMFGSELVNAFREFKRLWDPDGLMNPGKVVDAHGPADGLRQPGYRPGPTSTAFHFSAEGGMAEAALRCVGVGKCRKTDTGTMCPSYMATREEQHSTRGRAHLLFEMFRGDTLRDGWRSEEVKEALDLCLACKACKSECPVSVDMATYKAEFLSHYYEGRVRPLRAHLFGHVGQWAALASGAPRLANALAAFPLSRRVQSAAGVAPERRLPVFAQQTFQRWMKTRQRRPAGRPVVLWSDTFTNYFAPDAGRAAVGVLEHLGYRVVVPPQTCCGRPLYDFGLLRSARRHLQGVFEVLSAPLREELPIVVLEPSCFSVFRDEARNLSGDAPPALALAARAVLFSTFVRPHFERGDLPPLAGDAMVHVHCHEQALAGRTAIADVVRAAKLNGRILDAGCCGMAGAFGYDKQHYRVSIDIGERVLLPEVRGAETDTTIVADGFSCREQIRQQTERRAMHFAEVVWRGIQERS